MEGSTSSESGRRVEPIDVDKGIADGLVYLVHFHQEQTVLGRQHNEVYEHAGAISYHSMRQSRSV